MGVLAVAERRVPCHLQNSGGEIDVDDLSTALKLISLK